MSRELIRSLRSVDLATILSWSRDYNLFNQYPVDELKRFGIAIYQIYQGIDWKNGPNMAESYAASCIHFMLTSEKLNLNLEQYLPSCLNSIPTKTIDFKDLLYFISRAQQMLFYGIRVKQQVTERAKARYNEVQLSKDISNVISILIGSIQIKDRLEAIEDATSIMTGKL